MRTLRRLLIGLVLLAVLAGGTVAGVVGWAFWTARVDTVGTVVFDRELHIPPLADSRVDGEGRRVFDLSLQEGETDLGRDRPTPTWGVNGGFLGPTLRAERGERVVVNVTNELGEESTLHWHGLHLPAAMDGGPHQMVATGDTWSPTWEIDQPAATLWYHPHPHGATEQHVYRGVAGLFVIDDPAASAVAERLPSTYGVDDVPVIVQDKRFDGHRLDESGSHFADTGVLGEHVLVNGTPGPYLDVTTERVRLRLLNGSTARVYNFHLSDDRDFTLIGTDGGLLPEPTDLSSLELSPGERAEIVVAMTPGEESVLRSAPLDSTSNRFAGTDDALDVLQLRAAETLSPSPELPSRLADAPDLAGDDLAAERELVLSGRTINGRPMDMSRIDHTSEVGTTELWRVRNRDGNLHNFHVHDVQFTVRAVDGRPPPPELTGWKDTVFLPPQREYELLLRFTDHTDPDVPYMFHCHILRHEDAGMMGQFVVVEPGDEAGEVPATHDH
ncbi:multicopper oxidase family protein [Nocardioides sp.]|uniref:multicopper oxidase family protein n=1 Tax=Nocardioides sp. TaxID=35761 RepID=UPI0027328A91|nr:multicopper oxidase domain-containing protein [Nocardioides sp.]MDP3891985.1 multicopper oxidase domain-containing protein [Nocardioides sp.]